jgi:dynein heavy chain
VGQPPRQIEIQRKKALYKRQDIADLLRQRNVPFDADPEQRPDTFTAPYATFALEAFDNEDYEVNSVDHWLKMGTGADGEMVGLPAKALHNSVAFYPCRVYAFNKGTNQWKIEWDQGIKVLKGSAPPPTGRTTVPRIDLLFDAEDPFNFADRVASAHRARADAMALFRFHLSVECMPADDIPQLHQEQVTRILSSALNTHKLASSTLDTTSLLNEANIMHVCALNRICFAHNHKQQRMQMTKTLRLPAEPQAPPPPEQGVLPIPDHDFPQVVAHTTRSKKIPISRSTSPTNAKFARSSAN